MSHLHQTIAKLPKGNLCLRFHYHVGEVVVTLYVLESNVILFAEVTQEVMLDVDVLGPAVELRVPCSFDSRIVVTEDRSRF